MKTLIKIAWWSNAFIKQFFKKKKKMVKSENMTLREKQSIFALNISKLIVWAFDNGYETTKGEALRTHEQQMLYFEGYTLIKAGSSLKLAKARRKSRTMNSSHLKKLGEDINLFIDGEYQTDNEAYKPLAEYWKSLHPNNRAGYDWGWDGNHFEMK